jgi:hypothetical protein
MSLDKANSINDGDDANECVSETQPNWSDQELYNIILGQTMTWDMQSQLNLDLMTCEAPKIKIFYVKLVFSKFTIFILLIKTGSRNHMIKLWAIQRTIHEAAIGIL